MTTRKKHSREALNKRMREFIGCIRLENSNRMPHGLPEPCLESYGAFESYFDPTGNGTVSENIRHMRGVLRKADPEDVLMAWGEIMVEFVMES